MRRPLVFFAAVVLSLTACGSGSDPASDDESATPTSGTIASTVVPVPTPDQQADIDMVVKNWDVCLRKIGDDPARARAYREGARRLVHFDGAHPVTLEISGSTAAPTVQAADDATRAALAAGGADCQYS